MAFTSKPDDNPEFALLDQNDPVTGEANVAEPPAGKKNYGWAYLEKPGHNWMNWLHRKTSEWITYFNQFHSESEYVINTQADFNSLLTRTSANRYEFDDDALTIIFMPLSGGFQMSGVLSDGDSWGYIQTNNCKSLEFRGGAFIDFENERGYLEVNADDCYLRNVELKGTGTVAAAITQSFRLNAYRVTFDNCKCNTRLSNVDMVGFQGSGTALHNITSKYINCTAYDLDGSDKVYGIKDCMNLSNCIAYQLDSSSGSDICNGFYNCEQISACYVNDIDTDSGEATGFYSCDQISGCSAKNINSNSNNAIGFHSCDQISGCKAELIDSVTGATNGFYNCEQISACCVKDIDATAGVGNAFGFNACNHIAACLANDIDSAGGAANGFRNCNYGAAIYTTESTNSNNDWMDTDDAQITNNYSCPAMFT